MKQRIKLNAPNGHDGLIRVWIDGELMLDLQNMRLRIGEQGRIDSFYFSTFHGGQGMEWAPFCNAYARFDDIQIAAP